MRAVLIPAPPLDGQLRRFQVHPDPQQPSVGWVASERFAWTDQPRWTAFPYRLGSYVLMDDHDPARQVATFASYPDAVMALIRSAGFTHNERSIP
jgi:hypothetical protein